MAAPASAKGHSSTSYAYDDADQLTSTTAGPPPPQPGVPAVG
ncbi:hypothetical protein ACFPN0_25600 [Kitasatospora cinereorecta]